MLWDLSLLDRLTLGVGDRWGTASVPQPVPTKHLDCSARLAVVCLESKLSCWSVGSLSSPLLTTYGTNHRQRAPRAQIGLAECGQCDSFPSGQNAKTDLGISKSACRQYMPTMEWARAHTPYLSAPGDVKYAGGAELATGRNIARRPLWWRT